MQLRSATKLNNCQPRTDCIEIKQGDQNRNLIGRKNFQISQRGKEQVKSTKLSENEVLHIEEKPYNADIFYNCDREPCSKVFSQQGDLKHHQRSHTSE